MKLFKTAINSYIVAEDNNVIKCNEGDAIRQLYLAGVEFEDIEIALIEMMRNNDAIAHFGVNKMFMFTTKGGN